MNSMLSLMNPVRVAILVSLVCVGQFQSALAARNLGVVDGAAPRRVALIIGNGAYPVSPLKNPTNDAADMESALNELGFEVISRKNVNQREMKSAVREFGQKLRGAETGVFYYAGHGLQVRGTNYLVPVSADDIESEADAEDLTVSLDFVIRTMEDSGARFNIAILDACRNNPFTRSFRSTARGLAHTQAATGTLIAYATAPGSVAADGDARNGLYTKHLVRSIKDTDGDILRVFQNVRTWVVEDSGGKQTPWESISLVGDFYFKSGQLARQPVNQTATIATTSQKNETFPGSETRRAPPFPASSGFNLDDLQQEAERREGWAKWQARMQADFNQVDTLKVEGDLRDVAWKRFLSAYGEDNPYSDIDNRLRAEVLRRQSLAQPVERERAGSITPRLAQPAAGQSFSDCPECPEMVVIPAGDFEMGAADGETDEKPAHVVRIGQPFSLARTEVTQAQWRAVMGVNPSQFSNCGDTCPVEKINWNDVQEYLRKLSEKTGKTYRLPSEAEWEYACRAGGRDGYCGGENVAAVAWFTGNSKKSVQTVAGKKGNAWGLHDMSGNLWEWVEDCWNESYANAPTDGSAWKSGSCGERVLRGGSWNNAPKSLRSTNRGKDDWADRDGNIGFRPVRVLP